MKWGVIVSCFAHFVMDLVLQIVSLTLQLHKWFDNSLTLLRSADCAVSLTGHPWKGFWVSSMHQWELFVTFTLTCINENTSIVQLDNQNSKRHHTVVLFLFCSQYCGIKKQINKFKVSALMLTPCIYTIPCYLLAFATLPSSSTATGFPAHTLVELACLLKQLSSACPAACNWVRIVSKTSSSDAMLFYGSCHLVSYLHCMWVSLVQLKMMAGPGPAHLIFKFKRKQWQSELNDSILN